MRKLLFLVSLIMVFGCASRKDLIQVRDEWPDWARRKPVMEGYYTGVGFGKKAGDVEQYKRAARQNALNNLAEEISVTVSGESVLRTIEVNFDLEEYYSYQIITSSQEVLEGYELVDSYDGKEYYIEYYRLSKDLHRKLREEKFRKAMDKSVSEYDRAIDFRQVRDYRNALASLISALDEIHAFLHEPLKTTIDGEEVYLANFLVAELQTFLDDILIRPENPRVEAIRGYPLTEDRLLFSITDRKNRPVPSLPVSAGFSAQSLIDDKSVSNALGRVAFRIDKIRSRSSSGKFYASLDMDDILRSSTKDLTLRKIIWNMRIPTTSMEVLIREPVFFVQSNEKSSGKALGQDMLKQAFLDELLSKGYATTPIKEDADFFVHIESDTKSVGIQTAFLDFSLEIKDRDGKVRFKKYASGIEGEGMTMQEAVRDAYREGAEQIRLRVFVEVVYDLL